MISPESSNSGLDIEGLRAQVLAVAEAERQAYQQEQPGMFTDKQLLQAANAGQDGDAWVYCQLHRGRFIHDHTGARWYEWCEHFWREDVVCQSVREIDRVIDIYADQVAKWEEKKTAAKTVEDEKTEQDCAQKEKVFKQKVAELQNLGRKKCVLTLSAVGIDSLGITGEEWDRNPWLLACQNGTVDLRDGTLRPGRQEDFIKTVVPHSFAGLDIPAPAWESFLNGILDGDRELVDYLQRLLGYAITGLRQEHVLPILWGEEGRNGKGTMLETLGHVLGPLAGPVKSEMLLDQGKSRSSASPDSDIMALRGRRLAWASETQEGRRFDAGKVKWLVGGDTMVGREPYARREVRFQPSHTLFLLTNHRPKADPNDPALWTRIHLIPFNLRFVDHPDPNKPNERQRDPLLMNRLESEASAILSWLIRGCLLWQQQGLNPPQKVKAATESYRQDEDLLGHFIDECCFLSSSALVKASLLYDAYKAWCQQMGHKPTSGTRFGRQVKRRFDSSQNYQGVFYIGIGLKDPS
jgi:putative DNA primase/helicase